MGRPAVCGVHDLEFPEGGGIRIGGREFAAGDVIVGTDGKSYVMGMNVNVAAEIHPRCRCGTVRIDEE